MSPWDAADIDSIAVTDDLHISPFRADGVTFGTPTWIWSVVVDGRLFVRAYNGTNSRWFGAARAQKAGRITAAGTTRNVVSAAADPALNDRIDQAYEEKYAGSPYLPQMLTDRTRAATVEISPHGNDQSLERTPSWSTNASAAPA